MVVSEALCDTYRYVAIGMQILFSHLKGRKKIVSASPPVTDMTSFTYTAWDSQNSTQSCFECFFEQEMGRRQELVKRAKILSTYVGYSQLHDTMIDLHWPAFLTKTKSGEDHIDI